MVTVSVNEVQSDITKIISWVQNGTEINVVIDNKPAIRISRIADNCFTSKRPIGSYDNRVFFSEKDNGKITDEEFCGL